MLKTVRPPTDFIGPGVEVMVHSLAGDEVIKCKLHEQVTYTILASALLQRLSAQTNIPQKCFTLTINPTGFQFGFASSRSFTKSRKLLALPRSLQSPTIGPRYMSSVIELPSIAVGVDSAHGTIPAIRSGVRSHLTVQ